MSVFRDEGVNEGGDESDLVGSPQKSARVLYAFLQRVELSFLLVTTITRLELESQR